MNNFREVDYISVPKGLPRVLINNNKLIKAIVVYYKLKSLYKSGVIKNYTKRYKELASHPNVNCSESKLRIYISILKEYGFVYKDKSKNLHFVSKGKLKEYFNVSKFSYKISKNQICNLEYYLKGIVLENNLEQQKVKVIENIIFDEYGIGKEKGYKECKFFKKTKKFISNNLESSLKRHQARYVYTVKNNLINSMDSFYPFITLSRKGISKLINRKSKSSGTYLINKLKKLDLIDKDETNYIILESNVSYDYYIKYKYYYYNLLLDNNINYTYIKYSKGRILYSLPNNLQITLTSRF